MDETARKPTILYIEDDPASRMLVDRTLRYAGYEVFVAERGLEGIDLARSERPDLILTDIDLPDLNGREIATMLRSDEQFTKTPIVALTAVGVGEQRDLAMAAGITGYLTKPLDVESLPKQVEFYLKGGRDLIDSQRLSKAQARFTQELVARLESRIRELEEANKDLRRLDQMKDTFIQITAHELRTPLTLVYGYSRLLQDAEVIKQAMQLDPGTGTLLEGLVDAIERMQGIINEILTISRIMTGQIDLSLGPMNLGKLMGEVIGMYKDTLATRELKLTFNVNEWPTKVRADSHMMRLVFDNLLSNAIKYTPDGGEIHIYARVVDEAVEVHFVDTGIGISEEDQEFIFDRFHTVNDPQFHSTSKTAFSGGGLGLGLAICKGIVDAHGGYIAVQSAGRDRDTNPGSEFTITLPLMAKTHDSPA